TPAACRSSWCCGRARRPRWLSQRLWPWCLRPGSLPGRGPSKAAELTEAKRRTRIKDKKIKSLEGISFLCPSRNLQSLTSSPGGRGGRPLKVLKIMPVQKQTCAGHQTRFKAFVPIRDYNGHVGLGVKCSKEVATAIRGAIFWPNSPLSRAYWGNKIGKPRTLPCKVTGCCGYVLVCLIPAPRGTGIVSTPVPKKLLMMAGIEDCYTSARGCTATLGNLAKATLDLVFTKPPYQEFTDRLAKTHTRVSVQRTQAPAVATTQCYIRKIKGTMLV
uniref:Small ribosomal subunit protein uS5 n=2 Tax=Sus scrofa TaxID=9823 RepID=A0A4X1T6I9_PIG